MREIFIATRIVYFRPRTVGGPGENRVSRSNSSLASRARKKGGKKNFPIQAPACVRFLPRGLMGGWRDKGRRIMRGPPASGAAADGNAIAAFHDRRTIAPPVEKCPAAARILFRLRCYARGNLAAERTPPSTSIIPITGRTVTLVGIDRVTRNKKERKPSVERKTPLSLIRN